MDNARFCNVLAMRECLEIFENLDCLGFSYVRFQ